MKILIINLILFFNLPSIAQNFFPYHAGDSYQFRQLDIYYHDPIYIENESFFKYIVKDSVIADVTYFKITNYYYRFDSDSNKLFILLNNDEKLAFDYSKPAGSSDYLYFENDAGTYFYSEITYQNIFGQQRAVRHIVKNLGAPPATVKYYLAEDIGYYDYEYFSIQGTEEIRKDKSVISAIIDSTIINQLYLSVSATFPATINRTIPNILIPVDIETAFIGLVDTLRAEVVVYGLGTIIYENAYQGDPESEIVNVTLSSSTLSQADSVGFKIVCTDESIFNNKVYFPVTGFYFVPVHDESGVIWNLITPQLNAPNPHAMKFFTTMQGSIYGFYTQSTPPINLKNETTNGGNNFTSSSDGYFNMQHKNILKTDGLTGYRMNSSYAEKTTDSGHSWTIVRTGLSSGQAISFINNNTGWISAQTTQSTLLRTTDGGNTWVSLTPPPETYKILSFVNHDKGYAVTVSGKVYKTENSGEDWNFTNNILSGQYNMHMFESGNGWTYGDGIWRTSDEGYSWQLQKSGNFLDAHFFDEHSGWVIDNNTLLYTTNGGNEWLTCLTPPTGGSFLFLDFVNLSHGWIYTNNSRLLRTTNGGQIFTNFIFESEPPRNFKLSQNFPNPFNPRTSLQYTVGSRQFVTLKVYDILGNEIATLVNEEKPAGEYEVEFNGANLPSGIYFYQLKAGGYIETKKMVLLK
jgi:photosystem II stability/assembly factor-like uncharacterized protein